MKIVDHCITGNHPPRRAYGDELGAPAWLVSFPLGFEALTVTVYGEGLCADDAIEAAKEWITANKPDWADDEQWDRLENQAEVVTCRLNRTRYLLTPLQANRPEAEYSDALFALIKVDKDVAEALEKAWIHVSVAPKNGWMTSIYLQGPLTAAVFYELPDPEAYGLSPEMAAWLRWVDSTNIINWLPDHLSPSELVSRSTPATPNYPRLGFRLRKTETGVSIRFSARPDGIGDELISDNIMPWLPAFLF